VLTTAHANQNSDETMRQAREHAAAHDGATVAIWDDMSDPTNIGWILRTFTANGDWTDENV
jgi:tRNA G18 (ribose-2'-O)-methylase SpoU